MYTAAVITVSDKGARGEREDTSGPNLCRILEEKGFDVVHTAIVPDDAGEIQRQLLHCSDEAHIALVLTTGGTGFSPRDITPEATLAIVERQTPGIPEAMRAESMRINLPGSKKAAEENILAVIYPVQHGLDMLYSEGSADCGR